MYIKRDEYGGYYDRYIRLSNNASLEDQLRSNAREITDLMDGLSDEDALYRYEENKWTLKEMFGHLIDTERIFQYRALAVARGDSRALPGYDHNQYVENANFNSLSVRDLKKQYTDTRNASLSLFLNFTPEEMKKRGIVNNEMFTVRAVGYVIVGHELHHLNTIQEKYLPGFTD